MWKVQQLRHHLQLRCGEHNNWTQGMKTGGNESTAVSPVVAGATTASIHQSEAARSALSCPSERELRVPCYCEENVWRLAYRRLYRKSSSTTNNPHVTATSIRAQQDIDYIYHVVFISNKEKCVPMFCQRAMDDPDDPCFWDYHVILVGTPRMAKRTCGNAGSSIVIDMDSHLPYPCPVADYLSNAFRVECFRPEYREKLAPRFR